MGIKTDIFTDQINNLFYDIAVSGNCWLFGSDFEGSNTVARTNFDNIDALEKTIFGQVVANSDVLFMIENNVWSSAKVYDMYDDRSALVGDNYYVVVEPEEVTGDYYVFKCIFNNNGANSENKPVYSEDINETGGESNLADGYIWKYMFTVPYETVRKFKTQDKFPVVIDESTSNTATDGIHTILVTNYETNFGYEKVKGVVATTPTSLGRITMSVDTGFEFNEAADIYYDCALYVTKSSGEEIIGSKQYTIVGSGKIGTSYYIDIQGYDSGEFAIEQDDDAMILPRLEVTGDGSGAEGVPVFDSSNTYVVSINMLERGSGYTSAVAELVTPVYLNTSAGDVEAELRPIISPPGGHGSDPMLELRSRAICISGTITSTSTDIPSGGDYSKIALVYNPEFSSNTAPTDFDNRLVIEVADASSISEGDAVSQSNGVSGYVHEVANNTVYVVNYVGAYTAEFTDSLPLTVGALDINISSITESVYTQKSGDVLYVTDFTPITRSADEEEVVKLLVDF